MKTVICAALLLVAALPAQTAPAPRPPAPKVMRYLDPAMFDPVLLLPAPVAKESPANARELDMLHRLIASASPERLKQAHDDAVNEDPAIFSATLGRTSRPCPRRGNCWKSCIPRPISRPPRPRSTLPGCGPTARI
jgi:acid phosphatase (class A)